MSKNLDRVLDAWWNGKPKGNKPDMFGTHDGFAGVWGIKNPCWTDGTTLYSYAMPIAWRDDVGNVQVAPRETAFRPDGGGRGGISMTTRRHIDGVNAFLRTHQPDLLVVVANEAMAFAKKEKRNALPR